MFSDEDSSEEKDILKLNKKLKHSVFDQNIQQISLYLRKGADASLRVNKDAGNLLHHNRDPHIAALLISKGARIDARNRYHLTPLFLAITEGNYELAKVLLRHGASIHCFDKIEKNTPLNVAVLAGDLNIVKLLLDFGSLVNDQTNSVLNTPLHLALSVKKVNVQIFNLLLDKGADVNALNSHKESPIYFAVKNKNCPPFLIEKLINYGAFIDLKDDKSYSPIHYALDNENSKVIKLLLKHGADIRSYNSSGFNVLQNYIIRSKHAKLKIVKCLLKHSFSSDDFEISYSNSLTSKGLSPLLLASYSLPWIDIGIIKELLRYDANPLFIITDEKSEFTMFDEALLDARRFATAEDSSSTAEDFLDSSSTDNIKPFKEHTIQIMKWLIKYSAMRSKDNVTFMQSKLKNNPYYISFLNECLVELPLIEQELGVSSLYEFTKIENLNDTLPSEIVDKIIQIHATDSFKIYQEVVAARLKRSDLLNKLKCEVLCINSERGQIYVNWTVTYYLEKYLCIQDLLNLLTALHHQKQGLREKKRKIF